MMHRRHYHHFLLPFSVFGFPFVPIFGSADNKLFQVPYEIKIVIVELTSAEIFASVPILGLQEAEVYAAIGNFPRMLQGKYVVTFHYFQRLAF